MSKYYPDISHHHPVGDWEKIKNNCPFIITKATEGTTYVDPTLDTVIKECEKRKTPYWLYTFLRDGNELDQAKFMVETCKDKIGDCFVGYILDIEQNNAPANCQKALDYLSGLDYKIMIYTMYAQYALYKTLIDNRPEDCAWWEARYGLNDGTYSNKYPCHSGADLHQFTSSGTCPGISDKIDMNRITGQGKKESWFMTTVDEEYVEGREDGVPYFAKIKSKATTTITQFLHNRGFGAGTPNLSKIAALNCDSPEVKAALFALAQKGLLKKPDGLNKWQKKTTSQ